MYDSKMHANSQPPQKKGRLLKVAAYIRVSTDMADQKNSYETQERYFRQLLQRNPQWLFAGIYSDYGISGTSGQKRTGFRRILRHCAEHKIDRIICKSISRFARNTLDFMTALDILQESGTTIFFEKEGLDTSDHTSHFILTTLAAIAQEESRSISANIRWGNETRFPRGEVRNQAIYGYRYTGGYTASESGYRYRTVEIVPEEAAVVRWIFEQFLQGGTCGEIARNLNCRHIPGRPSAYTRQRQKHAAKGQLRSDIDEGWTAGQIRSILANERYSGDVLIQKTYTENYLTHRIRKNRGERTQYWARNHHPAIISRELFGDAQKTRETGALPIDLSGSRMTAHAFSRTLICAGCGRFYHVRNTHRHPIWFCPSTARNNGKDLCHNQKIYEEQLIRMFRRAILERFRLMDVCPADQLDIEDIMSGHFNKKNAPGAGFSREAQNFLPQMLARLETVQEMDFAERDRAFLQRRLQEASAAPASGRQEPELLAEQLNYMENYWQELEKGYDCRTQAIQWIRSLPEGNDGLVEFLNHMSDRYVKAFVLSITVHDPLHYTIHWFDDSRTQVQMFSNVKDHRCTGAQRGKKSQR